METPNSLTIDYGAIARQHQLQEGQVRATAELLDEGNTVPFITRYRKDVTGGLDEEKIRLVEDSVNKLRQLNERKERVLRSINSQDKLTPELEQQILAAHSLKTLDDLYLPFRPKKQTLATAARQKGLDPLAQQILAATEAVDIETICAPFVDAEKDLPTTAEVLAGVRNILAETFSERVDVRSASRKSLWHGQVSSKKIERNPDDPNEELPTDDDEATATADPAQDADSDAAAESEVASAAAETTKQASDEPESKAEPTEADTTNPADNESSTVADSEGDTAENASESQESASQDSASQESTNDSAVEASDESPAAEASADTSEAADGATPPEESASTEKGDKPAEAEASTVDPAADSNSAEEGSAETTSADDKAEHASAQDSTAQDSSAEDSTAQSDSRPATKSSTARNKPPSPLEIAAAKRQAAEERRQQRREARHRKRHKLEQSFKDYFDYSEPIKKLPHYRTLALNRGERCKVLRVKVAIDADALKTKCRELAVPAEHPYRELLQDALQDALTRLVIPSIEREVRRELTERAETHAVKVFAQNLRKLLLQAPLHNHRVLAIDPGFRSGCKLAALDEFGDVLGHSLIHVIGAAERVEQSRNRIVELVKNHNITVIAIGNGTACRETEQLVASVLTKELADADVHYLVVNEAGASVYSTSQIGRDELPRYDATVRGAVSIGRRALDPLSELVKIDPASIGVGLYQHDVKAKHLRTSLDAVVESCVNFVGVDVNSASPALLGYVSGLNQLTARRLYEYRQEHGPFQNRQQLLSVPGIGEATFVQSAGFLKIASGDTPLDATWIHPESYETARRVLGNIGCEETELRDLMKPSARPAEAAASAGSDGKSEAAQTEAATTERPTETPAATEESPAPESAPTEGETANETDAAAPEAEAADATEGSAEEKPSAPPGDPATDSGVAEASTPAASADANEQPSGEVSEAASKDDVAPAETAQSTPAASVLSQKLSELDSAKLAGDLGVGVLLLTDILANLARPGRDPREDLLPPAFRREILKLEELKPGMELSGTVLNVVDFGAFVDIGLSDSGLIHVSRLANHYVSDPHEVVSVGDVLNVWVVEVDDKRRRVSLTAIPPGSEVSQHDGPRKSGGRKRSKDRGKDRQAAGAGRGRRTGKAPVGKGKKPTRGWQQKKKPKPVVPITDAMERGDEPMRTFSDLQQFFKKKKKS